MPTAHRRAALAAVYGAFGQAAQHRLDGQVERKRREKGIRLQRYLQGNE